MSSLRNILIFLLFVPALAMAQATDPVQYAVVPEAPGPNQQVVIELSGVGSFLGDATVTWRKDGAVVLQGTGAGRYSFTTGAIGTQTTVDVVINSPTQGAFGRTFAFSPSTVNLVWEADTTVPPMFLGKPMYSAGSPLRVLALPVVYQGGARVPPAALSYRWSRGEEPVPEQSGLGRASIAFAGDQLKPGEDIGVSVYAGATLVAQGSVFIPATNPALVLYERDPLRGLLTDTAFPATINLLGKEITLQAQPFYFAVPDHTDGNLTYLWQLNGQETTGPDAQSGILTLRQTGAGSGGAAVSVSLQNYGADSFVQQAQTALQLLFGAQGSLLNNLFGI